MLTQNKIPVICSDEVAKEVATYPSTLKDIRKAFGDEVFDEEGNLDRAKLGDIIFADASKRKTLNKIYRPRIMWRLISKLWDLRYKQGEPIVVMDVPLLFEAGIFKWILYPIVCVAMSNEQENAKRLM